MDHRADVYRHSGYFADDTRPIGINSATYIGYVVTGSVLGSIVTTVTVMLPSFLLVLYASHFIRRHKESAIIKGVFAGCVLWS